MSKYLNISNISISQHCEVMKLADIPSCLGGEDNGINGKYFGVDHQRAHLAF